MWALYRPLHLVRKGCLGERILVAYATPCNIYPGDLGPAPWPPEWTLSDFMLARRRALRTQNPDSYLIGEEQR